MAEVFVSPGVYTQEIDDTFSPPPGAAAIGAAVAFAAVATIVAANIAIAATVTSRKTIAAGAAAVAAADAVGIAAAYDYYNYFAHGAVFENLRIRISPLILLPA